MTLIEIFIRNPVKVAVGVILLWYPVLTSGLHAISIGEVLRGGADPRREGIAMGR